PRRAPVESMPRPGDTHHSRRFRPSYHKDVKQMKAAVFRAHDEPYRIEEVALGELAADEVLVRVVGVGMCHTDMLLRSHAMAAVVAPAILGHEGSGVVEAVGSAVTRAK